MKPQCHAPRLTAVLWGRAVENENHCDFVKLREMLIRVNMEDLREQTHTSHYELYRRCKLEEMGFKDTDPDCKPFRCGPWVYAALSGGVQSQGSAGGSAGVPCCHVMDLL